MDSRVGSSKTVRGIVVAALFASAISIVAIPSVASSSPTWTPTEIALPGVPYELIGNILSLSCISVTSCIAVGDDGNGQPITVVGDPSTWTAANASENDLSASALGAGGSNGVSCLSATSCVAVGNDGNSLPYALLGDPSTWGAGDATEFALNAVGGFGSRGFLNAVDCLSATYCVAVGSDGNTQPLVIAGDPATWDNSNAAELSLGAAFGSSGSLAAISCTSATYCVAVGSDGNSQPIVLAGDPATWVVGDVSEITLGASFGSGGSANAVFCPSATYCAIAGYDNTGSGQPLFVTGNPVVPGSWNPYEATLDSTYGSYGEIKGITCTSATYCVAVGDDGTLCHL